MLRIRAATLCDSTGQEFRELGNRHGSQVFTLSCAHGDKAKISLRFRGREMAHQELGMELLKRVEADLAEYGTVEQHPKMEGRQLMMVIAPKKKK